MDVQLNKMCRICLKEGENFKSIFYSGEISSYQVTVSKKIMACSSVQVAAGDGLPELICLECLTQVDIAYDFRERCQSADATLRKYISLVKPCYFYTGISKPIPEKVDEFLAIKKECEENVGDSATDQELKIAESFDSVEEVKLNIATKNESFDTVEEVKLNIATKNESFDSVEEVKLNIATKNDSGVPLTTNLKKKKGVKVKETKVRKQKGSKKCQEGEGESGSDKKKVIKDEKDVKCPICEKTFAYLCILKDHMVQHTGVKPHLCSACGKFFRHTASLTNHMKTHYSDKPHKCDICELSFHRRAHLVLHTRTHTGEKPYVCDVCGRDFAQSSYLKEHMRVHSGEKPFVCDICGHGFARKSCLVMHRRIHTGELPYACPECGSAFSQRSQRKRHIKRNHKESACLRETGKLILKNLDLKNKNLVRQLKNENSANENSLSENSSSLSQDNGMMERHGAMPTRHQPVTSSNNSSMIIYQQDSISTLYPTTVMPLPLIHVQTTLLQ